MRAVPPLCIVYPGICLTTEENHGKPQSGYPKGAWLISVDLVIAGDDLNWPAGPCRLWLSRQTTGSTLGQRICVSTCMSRFIYTCDLIYIFLFVKNYNNFDDTNLCVCVLELSVCLNLRYPKPHTNTFCTSYNCR